MRLMVMMEMRVEKVMTERREAMGMMVVMMLMRMKVVVMAVVVVVVM